MIYFILCVRCTSSDKNPTRVKILLLAPFICYKIKYLRDVHYGVFLPLRQPLSLIICKLYCTCPQMVLVVIYSVFQPQLTYNSPPPSKGYGGTFNPHAKGWKTQGFSDTCFKMFAVFIFKISV